MKWMGIKMCESIMKKIRMDVRTVPQHMISMCEYIILAIAFWSAGEVVAGGVLDCEVIWLDAMLAMPLLIRIFRMKQGWQRNRSVHSDCYHFFIVQMMTFALCMLLLKTDFWGSGSWMLSYLIMLVFMVCKSGTTLILVCAAWKHHYTNLYIIVKLLIIHIAMSMLLGVAISLA